MNKTFQLVCVRHGESAWNKDNRFCGWVDVSLSENGIQEAHQAGIAVKKEKLTFDTVFTSTLKRAVMTANIILSYCDQPIPPLIKHWQLNERHYGALTGLNKAKCDNFCISFRNSFSLKKNQYTAVVKFYIGM